MGEDDARSFIRGLREWPTSGDKWGEMGCRTNPVLRSAVSAPDVLAQHATGRMRWFRQCHARPDHFRWHWRRWQHGSADALSAKPLSIKRTPSRPLRQSGRVREQKPPSGALKGVIILLPNEAASSAPSELPHLTRMGRNGRSSHGRNAPRERRSCVRPQGITNAAKGGAGRIAVLVLYSS